MYRGDFLNKMKTCFFTGHRVIASDKKEAVMENLWKSIEKMIIENDVCNFICGGAIGFDTLAAKAVIKMREKYPHIRLLMYLPCYGQSEKWTYKQKYIYRIILSQADEVKYITESAYTDDCMMKRNMEMVKDSFFCIAYCILDKSGTGATVRRAGEANIKIINIADEIYN